MLLRISVRADSCRRKQPHDFVVPRLMFFKPYSLPLWPQLQIAQHIRLVFFDGGADNTRMIFKRPKTFPTNGCFKISPRLFVSGRPDTRSTNRIAKYRTGDGICTAWDRR